MSSYFFVFFDFTDQKLLTLRYIYMMYAIPILEEKLKYKRYE